MGSKRLSDVVNEVFDGILAGEVVNQRRAAVEHWDDIDGDGQYLAGIEGFCARIGDKCKSVKLRIRKHTTSQSEMLFSLPQVVSMDLEDKILLPTRALSRNEFLRAIQIREDQIKADQKSVREWKSALKVADKFWAVHPAWNFGQCMDAAMGKTSSPRKRTEAHISEPAE